MVNKMIDVKFTEQICTIQFYRPKANNTINRQMVEELFEVIEECEKKVKIVVFEGNENYFCFGADFNSGEDNQFSKGKTLYDLWLKIAKAPFIAVSHIIGRVNAGGMGFVACSDIAIAGKRATFSLSELLFGLYPAMVIPFLIRRIGFQHTNYMTLMTKPFSSEEALRLGLVDSVNENSKLILGQHIARLKNIPADGIRGYKQYANLCYEQLYLLKDIAIEKNQSIFSSELVMERIRRYTTEGIYPWEV